MLQRLCWFDAVHDSRPPHHWHLKEPIRGLFPGSLHQAKRQQGMGAAVGAGCCQQPYDRCTRGTHTHTDTRHTHRGHPKNLLRLSFLGDTLIFFSLLFWKTARKTTKKTRIFYPCRTPKTLGKKGKTLKKARNCLNIKKARKFKKQGKEDQGTLQSQDFLGTYGAIPAGPTPLARTLSVNTSPRTWFGPDFDRIWT